MADDPRFRTSGDYRRVRTWLAAGLVAFVIAVELWDSFRGTETFTFDKLVAVLITASALVGVNVALGKR